MWFFVILSYKERRGRVIYRYRIVIKSVLCVCVCVTEREENGKREGCSGENREQDQPPSDLLKAQGRFAEESL